MAMRVAYLINQYPKVSHSFIRREILALERIGVDVVRVALRGWDSQPLDASDEAEQKRTHYVLREGAVGLSLATIRLLFARPLRLLRAVARAWSMSRHSERHLLVHLIYVAEACVIVRSLQSQSVDHVHAHFGTNSAEVAMQVETLGGPTWSFTVHGPEEFDKPLQLGLAEKTRRAKFVVAISSFGRSQIYRLVKQSLWNRVHVVHCGLDAAYFAKPSFAAPAPRRLVCVGRLCEQKGQLLLIEAVRRLSEEGVDFELVLAGDGEMRGDVEALIARYDLAGRIRITGWISGDQVRAELIAARALVLPSFAEGLPVVIMEAMALCRPVISTYVAGIPELVRQGTDGWLVPAGDVDALAQAMRACLDAPSDRLAELGVAACCRVQARHNIEHEAAKLAALFQARSLTRSSITCPAKAK